MHRIQVIDSHTGGEPTRVVLEGFPTLTPGLSLKERCDLLRAHDHLRTATVCEPRSSDVVVGAWLSPAALPGSTASVVFFNNAGLIGMCGHGTIGVIETLRHLGRINAGVHRIDTVVGTVSCTLHDDRRVTVENVPAYRWRHAVTLEVPGIGEVTGDVAWGGNWFFLTDWSRSPIGRDQIALLTDAACRIRQALHDKGITGRYGAVVDHVELFGHTTGANSRSFVLCPGTAYDRSPCGTGTSAKLACLAADGLLAPGQPWRQQSVIGSLFDASYRPGENGTVVPSITGRAHVSGEATLLMDEADPFRWGISASSSE